ncbi:unnamed protein product [Mesocestoides corti]|uniref:Cytosolic fatty-acid binding proteins domain-containing protein n=1 Tax=Mesocestoides corti TaxID=53468 RepID=A0A0R3U5P5_MESCO|nr:unnamed protein product [Mesocestoides corti]
MDGFLGTWKMVSSEGFDQVMIRLGVDYLTRKTGNAIKPVIKIERHPDLPDTFTLQTINTFRSTLVQFKLGEPFLETTVDGRKVKTVITLEKSEHGGSWILRQCQVGDKVADIERRLVGSNEMHVVRSQ